MAKAKYHANLAIRGVLYTLLSEENMVTVRIDRDFTTEKGVQKRHPMFIECRVPLSLTEAFEALEEDEFVEVNGILVPYHYIFVPIQGSMLGERVHIPDVDAENGNSQPWTIVSTEGWDPRFAHCSIFQCAVVDMGISATSVADFGIHIDTSNVSEADLEKSRAFRESLGLGDTRNRSSRNRLLKQSIYLEASGILEEVSNLISESGVGAEGEARLRCNFRLVVPRKAANTGVAMQPIRIRMTAWGDLAEVISGVNNGNEIALKAFLDPWWLLWSPTGTAEGEHITLPSSPKRKGFMPRPTSLWRDDTEPKWDPRSHLYQSFQGGNVDEVTVDGKTYKSASSDEPATPPAGPLGDAIQIASSAGKGAMTPLQKKMQSEK